MDHKCNICDEAFGTASELISHKQRIHEYKNYKWQKPRQHFCPVCNKTFASPSKLKRHMSGVKSTCKNVVAHVAQLVTKSEQSNAKHNNFKDDTIQIKVSTVQIEDVSNKPKHHSCSICKKNFPCLSKLRRHINGLKSTCQNAAFETVTESKNFQCKVCKMNFSLRQDLKEHLIKIHIRSKSDSIHSPQHNSSQP